MSKVVLYSPQGDSLGSVLALQQRAAAAGIAATECAVGQTLGEVSATMEQGDELVVDSLGCFSSLNELLGFVASRGVRVRSLAQEWFSAQPIADPLAYQCRLYELGSSLHAARTRQGLADAAKQGRKPGRRLGSKQRVKQEDYTVVDQVDQLKSQEGLSVQQACRQVGISAYVYYRKRRNRL